MMEDRNPSIRIERRQPSQNFAIHDMGGIFEAADGKTDVPHRHDYYTVILVAKSQGEHIIDYRSYPFGDHEVHFVSPGQVHQVDLSIKPSGWAITFSRDFLAENNIPESFVSNINLFKAFGESPPLDLDESSFEKLVNIVQDMEMCSNPGLTYKNRALGALLQLFLIHCNNALSIDKGQLDEDNKGICIFRDFKHLVDNRYGEWHKVHEYAESLHLSVKHLSQTVKNFTGKSAKQLIQDRIILEGKRLLLHTSLSVKEVAYQTGFEEPLHFSAFFKKQAGVSPSEYRTLSSK